MNISICVLIVTIPLGVPKALGPKQITPGQLSTERSASTRWSALECRSVREASVGLEGDSTPRLKMDDVEMQVTRNGKHLHAQVNQQTIARSLGNRFVQTDSFEVISENSYGISALHSSQGESTVHTLLITSSGRSAVWNGSSFRLGNPRSPFSSSVAFSCKERLQ